MFLWRFVKIKLSGIDRDIFLNFKDNLKQRRISNNLTQLELANLINVSVETIKKYEQGKNEPSFDILEK